MRRGADRDYVLSVGSSAYDHASAMLRGGAGSGVPDVMRELARKFERFVGVFSEVSDASLASNAHDDGAVLRLYERWRTTGSERLAEELTLRGLCPVAGPGALN